MRRAALFVDDEPRVLDGLRRGLRDLRQDWDLRFASGGEEALAALGPDLAVVVTDMRMPGLDGVDVLLAARERAPAAARVVLTGAADRGAARRATGVAHRFLAKPCETRVLRDLLPELADLAGAAGVAAFRVPPADPAVLAALRPALEPGSGVDAAALLEQDPAVLLTVLHAAASCAFGHSRACRDAREALEHLGPVVVRELLDEPGLLDRPGAAPACGGAGLAGLADHLPPGALGPVLRLWGVHVAVGVGGGPA